MTIKYVKNRCGNLIPYDITRIERAIEKAWESVWVSDFSFIEEVAKNIENDVKNIALQNNINVLDIEQIQDIVENNLMRW